MIYRAKSFNFVMKKWFKEPDGTLNLVGVREVTIKLTPEQEDQIGDLQGNINAEDFSHHCTISYEPKSSAKP